MTNPQNPNYKPGVGRLVTDRFDFQKHIDGTDFNHKSSGIELFPTVVINGSPRSNVQTAIEQLALNLTPPVVPDATSTVKGIIKLSGDIGGNATSILVTKIQGKPISNLSPTTNDLLFWNGTAWTPGGTITLNTLTATAVNATTANINTLNNTTANITNNNIVTGTVTNKISFTGASFIEFASNNTTPGIVSQSAVTGTGADFQITAQGTSDIAGNGGNVFINGGSGGPLGGSVFMQGGSGTLGGGIAGALGDGSVMFGAVQIDASRRVLGLLSGDIVVDSSLMPANSGDMVMYLGDANTNPTNTISPIGGSILYSSGGQIHIRQSDNLDITLGPESWGRVVGGTSGQMETFTAIQNSTNFTQITLTTFAVPNHTCIYVEAYIIGKANGQAVSYSSKLSGSYSREGGTAVEATHTDGYYIGNNTERVKRVSPDTDLWFGPTITLSGTTVTIKTGSNGAGTATTITWFGIIKIMTGPSFTTP